MAPFFIRNRIQNFWISKMGCDNPHWNSINVVYVDTHGAYNYIKPPNLLFAEVIAIGGGGGGGSGRKGASSQNRCGGTGGNHGLIARDFFIASAIAVTTSCNVGSGGVGGASVTIDSVSGNNGTDGGDTSFGTDVVAKGGLGGVGGGNGTATTAQASQTFILCTPAQWPNSMSARAPLNSSNSTGNNATSSTFAVTGYHQLFPGGNGGGLNTSNTQVIGGVGSIVTKNDGTISSTLTGGTAGTGVAGTNGQDNQFTRLGLFDLYELLKGIGTSGAGGGSHYLSGFKGGDGGDGGKYGGGGGGGGASTNTAAGGDSGKGGNGGDGILIIIEFLE